MPTSLSVMSKVVIGSKLASSGYYSNEYYISGKDFMNAIKPYYNRTPSNYTSTLNGKRLDWHGQDNEVIRKFDEGKRKFIMEKTAERILNNFDLLFLLDSIKYS